MVIFQVKDIFFQTLHPAALLIYLTAIAGVALLTGHPILLTGLMVAVISALIAVGGFQQWVSSLKFFMIMALMLLIINSLVNNMGSTVLWSFSLVISGPINITLENIVYSLVMCIRLTIIFSTFILYNLVMNPDRALHMFAKIFPRSVLLVTLVAKTIPYLSRRLQSAAEIQQCRGINYHTGNYISRIKNRLPLIKVLFQSSLEDSFNLSESIQGRAYGSGPRTSYFHAPWRAGDFIILAVSIGAFICTVWSYGAGYVQYQFYPQPGRLIVSSRQLILIILCCFLLIVPVMLSWGWEKWDYLKWII